MEVDKLPRIYAPIACGSFREDTAAELLALLRSKCKGNETIFLMGDFNSRLKRNAVGGKTGRYTPHKRGDDGGELMSEIMEEFSLIASNTLFKPTNKEARNTGAATYCQSKSYVQPKHKRYQSPQPPSTIDYILTSKRFRSSASSS